MSRFPPPSAIADDPALVRFCAYAVGASDRRTNTKRANFAPWMSRSDYLFGWKTVVLRVDPSKWDLRRHWRQCRRFGYVAKKLTQKERKARYA